MTAALAIVGVVALLALVAFLSTGWGRDVVATWAAKAAARVIGVDDPADPRNRRR